ncbi:unnamed protein product [Zymoseptoria tritici ST99CH_1A5]|uniref:Uncharacterized protein n=1 Tax=Zymoseptoria tritici ST99CH_1A5 TaxID=1276529 RepID=A0A1Y6LSB2_ZYMTR|nr:unnamed protein product [Zymoseptoria tritici ST99CH_1A5]
MAFIYYDECEPRNPLLSVRQFDKPSDRKERLRRFLSFCLAIDYNLTEETPDKLSKEDLFIFVDLARRCFLFGLTPGTPARGPQITGNAFAYPYLKPRDFNVADTVVQQELLDPAVALGIPCSVVVVMLRSFVGSFSLLQPGYRAQISWLSVTTGTDNLAARFFMERNVLFDALLPPSPHLSGFRGLLECRMNGVHGDFFEAIRGPNDYDTTALEDNKLANEARSPKPSTAPENDRQEEGCLEVCWVCKRALLMVKCISPSEDDSWVVRLLRYWVKPREGRLCGRWV